MDTPLLAVEGLRTTFRSRERQVFALDGIDLEVAPGEMVGVAGESGSGKSTMARAIMNLHSPATTEISGEIRFLGTDLLTADDRTRRKLLGTQVAMVFQDPSRSLHPAKRVGTLLTEAQRYHLGRSRREAMDRAMSLLREVGMDDPERRLGQYPHQLSGGMRQRVAIAVSLACEPQLLIADEPTTALDLTTQRMVLDLLIEIAQKRGVSVLLISHDLRLLARYTDRVVIMYAGKVMEVLSSDELMVSPAHPYTEALVACLPREDQVHGTPLRVIQGTPPELSSRASGCPFIDRCDLASDICRTPPPMIATTGSRVFCHKPLVTRPSGG